MLQWQSYCNINVSNKYVVHLQLTQYYMSNITQYKNQTKTENKNPSRTLLLDDLSVPSAQFFPLGLPVGSSHNAPGSSSPWAGLLSFRNAQSLCLSLVPFPWDSDLCHPKVTC